jgi:hypothetical protein
MQMGLFYKTLSLSCTYKHTDAGNLITVLLVKLDDAIQLLLGFSSALVQTVSSAFQLFSIHVGYLLNLTICIQRLPYQSSSNNP